MSFSLIPQMLLPGYGSLPPEMLRERGIRLLLCDLDYTLAPKYVPGPDEALHRWLTAMGEAGIRVMILSNNRSPVRVERFCRDLGIDYVGRAGGDGGAYGRAERGVEPYTPRLAEAL